MIIEQYTVEGGLEVSQDSLILSVTRPTIRVIGAPREIARNHEKSRTVTMLTANASDPICVFSVFTVMY